MELLGLLVVLGVLGLGVAVIAILSARLSRRNR